MDPRSFALSVTYDASPDEVFAAINDVRGWWSEEVNGDTDRVGAEFTFRGHDDEETVEHLSRIRVTELVPARRVVWQVTENSMSFITDQSEWVGTEIRFELTAEGAGTTLAFSHVGLVPAYECFDVCTNAWTFYIDQSLRAFIATGHGSPIRPSKPVGQPA
jgi:uncharacterized protein YndB with AHSA1/START domain